MAAPILVQTAGRGLFPGVMAGLMGGAGATFVPKFMGGKEPSEMSQLATALANLRGSNSGVTVVTGSGATGSKALSAGVACVCVCGAGYIGLRWAGISLTSLAWVTRRHFRKGIATLEKGLDGLSKRITEVRVGLMAKIEQVSGKQDKLASAQSEIRSDLGQLDGKVDGLGQNVNCIKGVVDLVANKIDSVEFKVGESASTLNDCTRGVMLLCRAVCNTIENRETSAEELRMLRQIVEKQQGRLAPPQTKFKALDERQDSWRDMVVPRSVGQIPLVNIPCATDVTRGWVM